MWYIPVEHMPSSLASDHKIIADFLLDPVDPNGKTAADLLRKKRKAPVRKRKERAPVLNSEGEEIPEPIKKRQKKRQVEETQYKSAQFIEDSDDDEEADRAFFAREAEVGCGFSTLLPIRRPELTSSPSRLHSSALRLTRASSCP